jgi:uncharacterized membrane protein
MKESDLRIEERITINRPPEEVYRYWRNLENLPRFMDHLESVKELGGRRSHWVLKAPAGPRLEWDAEITEDIPGEVISWRSLPGSEVEHQGTVRFARTSGTMATDLELMILYDVPGSHTTAKMAHPLTKSQLKDELERFKDIMEKGKAA